MVQQQHSLDWQQTQQDQHNHCLGQHHQTQQSNSKYNHVIMECGSTPYIGLGQKQMAARIFSTNRASELHFKRKTEQLRCQK